MLVVIGLMSASVMRSALSADMVANNARSQNFAGQAAQIALRYCERDLRLSPRRLVSLAPPPDDDANPLTPGPTNWNNFSNWQDASKRNEVPASVMASDDSSLRPTVLPQCMIETAVLEDGATVATIVTARGFSPDFSADSAGRTRSGSAVWVQSISRVQ